MFNSKSIIFSTRLVGSIAAVLLIISTFLAIKLSVYLNQRNEVHRAVMLYDVLFMAHPTKDEFEVYRCQHKLTAVDGDEMRSVREKGTSLIKDELIRRTLQSGNIEIFVYDAHYYYAYKMHSMYYYRSDEAIAPYRTYIFMSFGIMVLLLLGLYRYISSSINPLKELYVQIQRFAKGEQNIHIEVEGNDEVAQVANAFHDSVRKNQALEKSRSLFLRNVMHELKTPISKGKLLMHFLEGSKKDKDLMENLFEQMQGHLNDLARVESLTAKHLELERHTYALVDILDQAIDMLDANRDDMHISLKQEKVNVDFNLFAYAIKNLLDNALKYSDEKPIDIAFKEKCLIIKNVGSPFKESFETYLKAYQRDSSQHSLEGMGLGLYIVDEIITRHGFTLRYLYREGKHHFSICFV